jgi:hypothetical protein
MCVYFRVGREQLWCSLSVMAANLSNLGEYVCNGACTPSDSSQEEALMPAEEGSCA